MCFAIQIIALPFYFFCSPMVPVGAQFHTQMLMCWQSAAVFVLQVGQTISVVLPVLRVWHPVIHQEYVSSKKAKHIHGGVPLQSRNPQGRMYLKKPTRVCKQWGQWLICTELILATFIFSVTIFQVHLIFRLFFWSALD